jgi:hypothetical protein
MGNLLVLGNWEDGQPRNYYARTIKQPKLTNIPVYPSRRKRKGGKRNGTKRRGGLTRKNALNKNRSRRN